MSLFVWTMIYLDVSFDHKFSHSLLIHQFAVGFQFPFYTVSMTLFWCCIYPLSFKSCNDSVILLPLFLSLGPCFVFVVFCPDGMWSIKELSNKLSWLSFTIALHKIWPCLSRQPSCKNPSRIIESLYLVVIQAWSKKPEGSWRTLSLNKFSLWLKPFMWK